MGLLEVQHLFAFRAVETASSLRNQMEASCFDVFSAKWAFERHLSTLVNKLHGKGAHDASFALLMSLITLEDRRKNTIPSVNYRIGVSSLGGRSL